MNRRNFLASACAASLLATRLGAQPAAATMRTRWIVRGSEGFDALSFLSPLSGDPFYADYYKEEVGAFAARLPATVMATIKALKARAKQANILLSPFLDLRFSAGPDATIADLIASLDAAERVLRPPLEASPYWDGEGDWRRFMAEAPAIRSVLMALREAGFGQFRSAIFAPKAAKRFPLLREKLNRFDVVGEVERFTGRTLEADVEVVLLEFCKPHGIKVIGQKFLSAIDWDDDIVIRTAGHELLHPPVRMEGEAAKAALAVLSRDPLLQRIVKEHDPAFGYNSLEGLFDEDLASALDQLIAERLGVARDPAERWTEVDGGMHILSAAFYGMMKRDGFAATGGDLETWLLRKVAAGGLAPPSLHRAAAEVLKRPADRLWPVDAV
ncbi:MAG TPA: hypothetical protein VGW34_12475 [Allosphingosinicella sp.]|nr:hypothetical protein [Allosphingosinicella sp.]